MGTDVTVTSIKHGVSGGRGTARGSRVYSHWSGFRSEEEQVFSDAFLLIREYKISFIRLRLLQFTNFSQDKKCFYLDL